MISFDEINYPVRGLLRQTHSLYVPLVERFDPDNLSGATDFGSMVLSRLRLILIRDPLSRERCFHIFPIIFYSSILMIVIRFIGKFCYLGATCVNASTTLNLVIIYYYYYYCTKIIKGSSGICNLIN